MAVADTEKRHTAINPVWRDQGMLRSAAGGMTMNTRNLSLTTRTVLAFGCICLLLLVIGGSAVWQLRTIDESVVELHRDWMPSVRQAGKVQTAALMYRVDARRFSMDDDRMSAESLATLDQFRSRMKAEVQAYGPLVSSPEEAALYREVSADVDAYIASIDQLVAAGKDATVQQLGGIIRTVTKPVAAKLQVDLEKLIAINEAGADASSNEAHEAQVSGVRLIGGVSLLALVLTVLIARVFINSILRPVRALLVATEQIANGNLRADISAQGADELTRLESATLTMRDNLRSMLDLIGQSSMQLSQAAGQLNTVTRETTATAEQQSMETDQAATAVNEMTAAVEEVARNASAASQSSQRSEQAARLGKDKVNTTIASIKRLSDSVRKTRSDVEDLASKSHDIAKVLDVIRTIAEQTNLLALNAAIEAARAGEQGRGFAVVADEVRALAHRTQLSTQEIEKMIAEIQGNSEATVTSMRRSDSEVGETLASANDTGEAIAQIAEAISDINERNLLIATASEEQAQVARSVDENLVSIRDLSARSAAAAGQTSAASQEMSRLAGQLDTLVGRFVI
ncbi:methyl-accepting chemotaxis protein [Pseudomonas sp. DTU_2021_1001937_2_SI_NGA_ILE_001]|uniref:methyl-accepting chemotaxis protein n=1 Tax=Pseudomonas sp. DTU_2021_1001937_2_SI_NGA_ILE_001 TaxID=3077589 RepID=UPI00397CACFD